MVSHQRYVLPRWPAAWAKAWVRGCRPMPPKKFGQSPEGEAGGRGGVRVFNMFFQFGEHSRSFR